MKCGAKRYLVILERSGQVEEHVVIARSSIDARKQIRKKLVKNYVVQSVRLID